MNPSPDDPDPCGCADEPRSAAAGTDRSTPYRVQVIDADPAWRGLLEEWMSALGCVIVPDDEQAAQRVDLVIVDVPFPRQGGVDLVQRVASRHPATPILALSSTFFSRIECCGPVARALGVDCVLPKPATREAITAAVRRVLPV